MKSSNQLHGEITELLEHARGIVDITRLASIQPEYSEITPRSLHAALWRVVADLDKTLHLVDEWLSISKTPEMA